MASRRVALDIDRLQEVLDALNDSKFSASEWFTLGLRLNLKEPELKNIEVNHEKNVDRCLQECIAVWLKTAPASERNWDTIATGLEKMSANAVAEAIRNTIQVTSDVRAQLEHLLEHVEVTGKELGRGAYGVVTEVRVSGTICAGKMLHGVEGSTLVKFAKEYLCHSQQLHPNIVQLMGIYYPPGSQLPMLVMEYLPLSLIECLEKQTLPLHMKYSILFDVAKGLAYLHHKKPPVIHRDLTANNVLLTSDFIAKISDLGVARMTDPSKHHQLTTAPGSNAVMPPEALEDNPCYNHKLDVFSYGCLILHVLTGQFPVPTKQYVSESRDSMSFIEVKEWDRRSQYIEQITEGKELIPFAKRCLSDKPSGRPEMIEAVQFMKGNLSQFPKQKNKIELIRENEELLEAKSLSEVQETQLQWKISADYKPGPPLSRADKVPRTEATFCITNGNIAAIDFGTTSVSLAYTTRGDKEISTLVLGGEDEKRVPNAVLLKREGKEIIVTAFGKDAKKESTSKISRAHSKYIYLEQIKILIRRDQTIDRQTLVESFSSEKFYLVEVIAFILKYLKDQLIDDLSRSVKPLKTTDFDWVITVPAIWDARGKRMMREAAYLAGLLTTSGGITQFTTVSGRPLPLPNETNHERLSLALEPESAALYSQETVVQQIEAGSKAVISRPSDYMVIDIGGGTVDITAHAEVNGGIIVENIPTGNAYGETRINEAFSKMLQEIVSDPEFSKFLASGNRSQQMAALNKILYNEFEEQKVLFGHCKVEDIIVDLPGKFIKFYDQALEAGTEGLYTDELCIPQAVVESKLFGPALDGIIGCTLSAIEENECKVNTFYLTGRFGGCKYVHQKVTAAIEKLYHSKGLTCNVVIPPLPQLAVAIGAVMWRRDPGKVKARRADATYGIEVDIPFKPEKHEEHYCFYNEDDKLFKCKSVFNVFIEMGELANDKDVVTTSIKPYQQSDTSMSIVLYSTLNRVQYTVDKKGRHTVTKIGQLVIDIPNPDNLPRERREVDVTMDFSGTEIQAKAKYHVNGKDVKIVCDFLSVYND